MSELIFLEPIFHEKIWGGNRLNTIYNYEIPSEHTGECWAISAHKNGDCKVSNGIYKGMHLSQLWTNHREVFGNVPGDVFPLLTKILDASDDLSVQVHPDDEYGLRVENELGKTECWYILDADEGAELIFGHHAKTKEEFTQLIEAGKWNELLRTIPVKKGDFFQVPTGTVHALKKGTLVLETQQSSDTTYRLYDYDRLDDSGNLRPLHIQKSIDVTTVPHVEDQTMPEIQTFEGGRITNYVTCDYFTVSKWDVNGQLTQTHDKPFTLISVLEGTGTVNGQAITKGNHFIVSANVMHITVEGSVELMVSSL
ncbi:MAG: mannose-6-phosphate isomerase, class I [Turicibacter sp.]